MTRDPYEYFRPEARELVDGLTAAAQRLGTDDAREIRPGLLRMAHTLKGAARVVGHTEIADLAHRLEDQLTLIDDSTSMATVPRVIDALLREIDGHVAILEHPRVQSEVARGSAQDARDESFSSIRVQVTDLDVVASHVAQAGTNLGGLARSIEMLDQARAPLDRLSAAVQGSDAGPSAAPAVLNALNDVRASLRGVAEDLHQSAWQAEQALRRAERVTSDLRFLQAASMFEFLERATQDAARATKKEVTVEFSGGETRIDAYVVSQLREALLHIVRNAVAHGIEAPDERVAEGKPQVGRVAVRVERRGGRVSVVCEDDGRGLDTEAVRQAAVRRGHVTASEAAALDARAVARLLLRGGISTASAVSQVSGRGIGFDVVRQAAARLNGDVSIESETGQGVSVRITVLASLVGVIVLRVESGDCAALVPLESIVSAVRLEPGAVHTSRDGDSVLVEGKPLPFAPLWSLLHRPAPWGATSQAMMGLVLRSPAGSAVVGLDRIQDVDRVVMREPPAFAGVQRSIAGVCLDATGAPQLVVDAAALVEEARSGRATERAPSASAPLPILVVDDSLTTRMLEQAILESAGYIVELAVSGEEGLAKAMESSFGIFLVDVEMPGIDGFEFIRRARSMPEIADVPVILVTSLDSPEAIARGREAGAQAHIVKGDFDQARLLEAIRNLGQQRQP